MTTVYTFAVYEIRGGQPRAYADSDYEYVVTSDQPEHVIKRFCTGFLKPHNQSKENWKKYTEDAPSFFRGYHEFDKLDEHTWRYHVHIPYAD